MIRFWHDGNDGENVNVAERWEVGTTKQGRTDADKILALMGVFGDFEGDGLDTGHDFRGVEGVPCAWLATLLSDEGVGTVLTGR